MILSRKYLAWFLGAVLTCSWSALPTPAQAEVQEPRVSVGGYLRLMARPDFQGGHGKLGHWNLYGRLLNEGPWAALELRLLLLRAQPGSSSPWARAHFRIEGGTVAGGSGGNGSLAEFRLSRAYVEAGGGILPGLTWRIGTLETWFGDLGLYDMRPSQLFEQTLGLSAQGQLGPVELMVGLGDSGFPIRQLNYSPILTAGGFARLRAPKGFELALGGQVLFEPSVQGSRNAPYDTPGIDYEDWLRGEVVENFLRENPGQEESFPDPVAAQALSGRLIGYLGFGGLGPLLWNSVHASFERRHPLQSSTESLNGEDVILYTKSLTDQRFQLTVGNEMQLELVPNRLELAWGLLYGNHWDEDNEIAPSDHDRWYLSTVLRLQAFATPFLHFLVESSIAQEVSTQGNIWRNHGDSIFQSSAGQADSEGLEFGDADTRTTWQGKAGVVLSPLGAGIYARPSLRVLYGIQYSTQNNAFGNSFVEEVSQWNDFGSWETHLHHVLALEVEAWF
ncbi:MAG: hypothetical protein CMP23_10240 [Rickettsiales bacterium]|nr:hypothetical protein [Rickettsiales bacterium]